MRAKEGRRRYFVIRQLFWAFETRGGQYRGSVGAHGGLWGRELQENTAINTLIRLLIALCRRKLSWFSWIRQKAKNRVNTKSANVLLNALDPSNLIGISLGKKKKKTMAFPTKRKYLKTKIWDRFQL